MTDKQIEKALEVCSVCKPDDWQEKCSYKGECEDVYKVAIDYINRLKAENADLTVKLEATEQDRENLLRTLEEANEEIQQIRKETAKEILRYLYEKIGNTALSNSELVKYLALQYGVEVDE